jgi:hypothetical protein
MNRGASSFATVKGLVEADEMGYSKVSTQDVDNCFPWPDTAVNDDEDGIDLVSSVFNSSESDSKELLFNVQKCLQVM